MPGIDSQQDLISSEISQVEQPLIPQDVPFLDGTVRGVVTTDGKPWIVAQDLLVLLGQNDGCNTSNVLEKISSSYRLIKPVIGNRGSRSMALVDQIGATILIVKSRRPEADELIEKMSVVWNILLQKGSVTVQDVKDHLAGKIPQTNQGHLAMLHRSVAGILEDMESKASREEVEQAISQVREDLTSQVEQAKQEAVSLASQPRGPQQPPKGTRGGKSYKSLYFGSVLRSDGLYDAQINVGKVKHRLGAYTDPDAAATVRDEAYYLLGLKRKMNRLPYRSDQYELKVRARQELIRLGLLPDPTKPVASVRNRIFN